MTEEESKLRSKLNQLCFILGAATSLIDSLKLSTSQKKKYAWVIDATEKVLYQDKSLPPFPKDFKDD